MDKILIDIAGMWGKSKILFFLLLPLVLLAIAYKLYREYQVMRAKQSLEKAEKTHEQLEKEKQQLLADAEKAKQDADEAAKRRAEREEGDINENWHEGD